MSRKLRLLLLVTACAAGCQIDDDAAAVLGQAEARIEPTSATLLQLRLSPTHTVKFLEASDGDLEVIEDMHADHDRAQPSLAAMDPGRVTLAEIHAHLRPGERVPDVLVSADTRAAAREPRPPEEPVPADAFTEADALGPGEHRSGVDSRVSTGPGLIRAGVREHRSGVSTGPGLIRGCVV